MATKSETKIPAPLYAAAGAGDLAYQQIRKLPERVAELRGKVAELRPVVTEAISEQQLRADLGRLRGAARRNAAAVVTGAQAAQERATAVYTGLVARGERVVKVARNDVAAEIAAAPSMKPAPAATPIAATPAKADGAKSGEAKSGEAKSGDAKSGDAKSGSVKRAKLDEK